MVFTRTAISIILFLSFIMQTAFVDVEAFLSNAKKLSKPVKPARTKISL